MELRRLTTIVEPNIAPPPPSPQTAPRNITSRCTILSVCFSLLLIAITILAHLHTASSAPQLISNNNKDIKQQQQAQDLSARARPITRGERQDYQPGQIPTTPKAPILSKTLELEIRDDGTGNNGDTGTNDGKHLSPTTASGQHAANGTVEKSRSSKRNDKDDDEDDSDSDSTTTVIDYNQQGYNLSTTSTAAISKLAETTTATTAATTSGSVVGGDIDTRVETSGRQTTTIVSRQLGRAESAKKLVLLTRETDGGSEIIGHKNGLQQQQAFGGQDDGSDKMPSAAKLSMEHINQQHEENMRAQRDAEKAGNNIAIPAVLKPTTPTNDQQQQQRQQKQLYRATADETANFNATKVFQTLFKKKAYSKLLTVEEKWIDVFERFIELQKGLKNSMVKKFIADAERFVDLSISPKCSADLKYIQDYAQNSTNFRWLAHMFDATGKGEPGALSGNLAELGHVVQCIKVRAPAQPSNHTFSERYFEAQTELLGERFRGKYCLASIRPVLPEKPRLVSRFSDIIDGSLISNISFMGEPEHVIKARKQLMDIPDSVYDLIDRYHNRLDQIPFESELYEYIKNSRNFIYSLPRVYGVCYPSSCTKEDIRLSIQKSKDDQHTVVDIEFDCEQDEISAADWFITPRVICYMLLFLVVAISLISSITRFILVSQLGLNRRAKSGSPMVNFIMTLDYMSMDKCAGILFVKTKKASPIVDRSKPENNRSTSIDALKGALILILVYSELVHLGGLSVPFMWSKWTDSMFPFYRALFTQIFLNVSIWSETFYIISAYLIGTKLLENYRPSVQQQKPKRLPDFVAYTLRRYIRLVSPMVAFILFNYVWPRLSNGFVMQDQANKIMKPCDSYGWTNMLMFHNHYGMNETCLWPSHVSATFFQLHLISFPILLLLLFSLRTKVNAIGTRKLIHYTLTLWGLGLLALVALVGLVYPALVANTQELIVPFLIDYIDFDNYKRVIEWTIMPTYNHLTSYMAGLALAYLVVWKRLDKEVRNSEKDNVVVCEYSNNDSKLTSQSALSRLVSILAVLIMLLSVTVSWFWNGLGQPMSFNQVFWYSVGTKLFFTIAFAYIFYKHFATRRNSSNPWLITRFLVPIGRMSLMVFYVSWLVIWFDLLASLYQWHPSHYFVLEKFNEIIFMTLAVSIFAYGAFEGIIKRVQYESEPMAPRVDAQGFESLFIPVNGADDDEEGVNK